MMPAVVKMEGGEELTEALVLGDVAGGGEHEQLPRGELAKRAGERHHARVVRPTAQQSHERFATTSGLALHLHLLLSTTKPVDFLC
jgi:hypothetical protein